MNVLSSVTSATSALASQLPTAPLTTSQTEALAHLHGAAQQFEGVFLGMMLKEMRSTVPADSLFGNSNAQDMFNSMLDDQRAQSMAQTGSLGIGKLIEGQLRGSVLANAKLESQTTLPSTEGL